MLVHGLGDDVWSKYEMAFSCDRLLVFDIDQKQFHIVPFGVMGVLLRRPI